MTLVVLETCLILCYRKCDSLKRWIEWIMILVCTSKFQQKALNRQGYFTAYECAHKALLMNATDKEKDPDKFESHLLMILTKAPGSNILSADIGHLASLAVDAVLRLKGSTNFEFIHMVKKAGGSLKDSFLVEGHMMNTKFSIDQPTYIQNAKILIANTIMDPDRISIFGVINKSIDEGIEEVKVSILMKNITSSGINCVVNPQLICKFPDDFFADAGILAIEHADFDEIEKPSLAVGGRFTSIYDNPEILKLGHCNVIKQQEVGGDNMIHFSKLDHACTIVLRGSSLHELDEAERWLHSALVLLQQPLNDNKVLVDGGWPEMVKVVDDLARETAGKTSPVIEAFARAPQATTDVGIRESFEAKQVMLWSANKTCEIILSYESVTSCLSHAD